MNLNLMVSDVKRFLQKKQNCIYFLLFINIAFSIYLLFSIQNIHETQMQRIEKVEKKVDFRYFNTVRTLEDVYNISVDTKNGKIKNSNHRIAANQ